eukprot:354316-Chlamydomonas_euryale.AAC.7
MAACMQKPFPVAACLASPPVVRARHASLCAAWRAPPQGVPIPCSRRLRRRSARGRERAARSCPRPAPRPHTRHPRTPECSSSGRQLRGLATGVHPRSHRRCSIKLFRVRASTACGWAGARAALRRSVFCASPHGSVAISVKEEPTHKQLRLRPP